MPASQGKPGAVTLGSGNEKAEAGAEKEAQGPLLDRCSVKGYSQAELLIRKEDVRVKRTEPTPAPWTTP